MDNLVIRNVKRDDLEKVVGIEAACFPAAEAAGREAFAARIEAFSDWFLVAEIDGEMIGFINGCVTDSPVIFDEMFHDTAHHNPQGKNMTIFGLDVVPRFRKKGIASQMMQAFIVLGRERGREKILLTCKDHLVDYYASFGYVNQGVSASNHGGAQWFDMELAL